MMAPVLSASIDISEKMVTPKGCSLVDSNGARRGASSASESGTGCILWPVDHVGAGGSERAPSAPSRTIDSYGKNDKVHRLAHLGPGIGVRGSAVREGEDARVIGRG